ncbi:MAG: outer membrane beta-barrel protein [Gallionella sp.]|nr:outer membrane beta-barrel protein [Gallionella sp.]
MYANKFQCKKVVLALSALLWVGNSVAAEEQPLVVAAVSAQPVSEAPVADAVVMDAANFQSQEAIVLAAAGGGEAADYVGGGKSSKPMTQLNPASIKAEPFTITPWANLIAGSDDNVSLASAVKTKSNFYVFNPNVMAGLRSGMHTYTAMYSGNFARYTSSSQDNYNDNAVGFDANNSWTARFNTLVHLDYLKGHDGRNALGNGRNTLERWHNTGLRAKAHYGAEGAQGQFEVAAGLSNKRYETNLAVMNVYDVDKRDLSAAYFHRVGAATQAIIEVRDAHLTYPMSANSSSTERRYLVGAQWEATAKTSGSFKIGRMNKSFDSGVRASGSGATWEGGLRWSPLTYSVVDVTVGKAMGESSGVGNFMDSRQENLAWHHDWSSRVRSTLTLGATKNSYQGVAREDSLSNYGVKVSYGIQRWLRAGAEIQQQKRSSTAAGFDYTRNLVMFSLEGSL